MFCFPSQESWEDEDEERKEKEEAAKSEADVKKPKKKSLAERMAEKEVGNKRKTSNLYAINLYCKFSLNFEGGYVFNRNGTIIGWMTSWR